MTKVTEWLYWLIVGGTLIVGCASIPSIVDDARDINPWELAHKECSKLSDTDAAKCHLGVAVARDACSHGVRQVECPSGVDPNVCATVNSALTRLCDLPAPTITPQSDLETL